jgi:hypothetical protein
LNISQKGIFISALIQELAMQIVDVSTQNTQGRNAAILAIVTTAPLAATRLAGQRMRELWLTDFAAQSLSKLWNLEEIKAAAADGAVAGLRAGNLHSVRSALEVARQGRIAAHPDVRAHFKRLVAMRDRIWLNEPDLVRAILHGPSQLLIDILQAQKEARLRHHVASDAAYIRHLLSRKADRDAGRRRRR